MNPRIGWICGKCGSGYVNSKWVGEQQAYESALSCCEYKKQNDTNKIFPKTEI